MKNEHIYELIKILWQSMSGLKFKIIGGSFLVLIAAIVFWAGTVKKESEKDIYLYIYYKGDGDSQEALFYAYSKNGLDYTVINNEEPVVSPLNHSSSGGLRDPFIIRTEKDSFYMTATDLHVIEQGWNNIALVLLRSNDLINWSSDIIDLKEKYPEQFGDIVHVWAPEIIYDNAAGKYMVYFSVLKPGERDVVYYAYANKGFTALESAPKLLYRHPDGFNCQDPSILIDGDSCFLSYRTMMPEGAFQIVSSTHLTSEYHLRNTIISNRKLLQGCGNQIVKNDSLNTYVFMYCCQETKRVKLYQTNDLLRFRPVEEKKSLGFEAVQGSVIKISVSELEHILTELE